MGLVSNTYARPRADHEANAPPGLVSTSQAAQAIGCGIPALMHHVKKGTFVPRDKVGSILYWHLDDLITEWAQKVKSTTGNTPEVIKRRKAELQAASQPAPSARPSEDDDTDLTPERYERERTLKLIAERRILERNDRKQAGELVEAAAITQVWNAAAIELRDGVMVIGARLCQQLADMTDARAIKSLIEAEHRRVLTSVAKKIATAGAAAVANAKGHG
jgi:hypothetical protein